MSKRILIILKGGTYDGFVTTGSEDDTYWCAPFDKANCDHVETYSFSKKTETWGNLLVRIFNFAGFREKDESKVFDAPRKTFELDNIMANGINYDDNSNRVRTF